MTTEQHSAPGDEQPQATPETPKSNGGDAVVRLDMTVAGQLTAIARGGSELFHDKSETAHATILIDGTRQTCQVDSRRFKRWLAHGYYKMTQQAPSTAALNDALNTIGGYALFECAQHPVYSRIAWHEGELWIDLGDDKWTTHCIASPQTMKQPPRFVRSGTIRPLPMPDYGEISIDELWDYLHVPDDARVLVLAWLLMTYHHSGPFPILVLEGPQGAGKSWITKILRALIDPREPTVSRLGKSVDDEMIAAKDAYIQAYDNLSGINDQQADFLCRLATGGGLAKRKLYTDCDVVSLSVTRPCILNGIDALGVRGDLLDRCVVIDLRQITQYEEESILWRRFQEIQPKLLGLIFKAVQHAYANMDSVKLDDKPRMADFARFACAALPKLGVTQQAFTSRYRQARKDAITIIVESDVLFKRVHALQLPNGFIELPCTEMLERIHEISNAEERAKLPQSGRALRVALRRLAGPCRELFGWHIYEKPRTATTRSPIVIDKRTEKDRERENMEGVSI